ncbi:phage tail protein [Dyella acidiphila]|uniref:Phage tail protein n=1 Tax=Dyella acidiphila TaxID=2775866 RepID=A0ABR9GEI6_9GAMM|nr:tail fiber protein [Dyella acidiphila]MBE1162467.1 phage tail protein [Dyella acidiphila]
MSEFYVGQIMMTGFGFAQRGFAFCNGQLLPIQQNTALFSLLGVQYGGNGTTNFQLPNLQGRTPTGSGPSADPGWQPSPYTIGEVAGVENVTLIGQQLPMHTHPVNATTATGNSKTPANALLGTSNSTTIPVFAAGGTNTVPLYPPTISMTGGSGPHGNMQPFRVINFNIALTGIYPSRS